MVWRPLPITNPCPNCGAEPIVNFGWFSGSRAECACGVSGPWVDTDLNWPEHEVLIAWAKVAGQFKFDRPPPPCTDSGVRSPSPRRSVG